VLGSATVVVDIGRSLREAFFMFWETLWPLVLGFGLAGAVQAFVSRDALRRRLGDHRAPAVARASGYGMVSSSCSYAASAMAKSLFAKGADFVTAMAFMFASTNLVIELGIVLLVLMGWQFALSEYVGGVIMIVLLATLGALWLRGRVVARARRRVETAALDLALQVVALWYADLACLSWGAPDLVRNADRLDVLESDSGASGADPQRLREAVEAVEDTRLRFQLNVSEELACESLGYRLERLLAA